MGVGFDYCLRGYRFEGGWDSIVVDRVVVKE